MTPHFPSMLVFAIVVVTIVALFARYDNRMSRLDRCQARFEASPEGRGYNWPVFHQDNSVAKLTCRDVSSVLRVCDVTVPSVDPITGAQGALIHEPFACNTVQCGWLKE